MSWRRELSRLRALFRRPKPLDDLKAEIRSHLEMEERENLESGMGPDESHYAALRRFGNVTLAEERSREMWTSNSVGTFLQDIRYGLRQLRRSRSFTIVAVLTLALGIGATTAIFSVVYGVLLRPLPYPKPNEIVSVSEIASDGHLIYFADPDFHDIRAANHTLSAGAEFDEAHIQTVVGPSGAARLAVSAFSQDFFRVMGVSPIMGRRFSSEDQQQGATLVALASYEYWRQELDGSRNFSSVKLTMAGHAFSIVGVMPPGFSFPLGAEIWFPRGVLDGYNPSRTAHNALVVARMRDGVTLAQARSDVSTIARRLYREYRPDINMTDASVVPLRSSLTSGVRPVLLILLGAVGFLLLVACANVANLLLARAAARGRELAIRAALGAGRARLVRQFLAESLLLVSLGGTLGVLLAIAGVDGLLADAVHFLPRTGDVSVNLPVLAFAIGISFLIAAGLGIATALHATGTDPQAALAEGSRGAGGSLSRQRLGHSLVTGQVAVTLMLLTGAGLLGRSLLHVLSLDPGFRTHSIVTMEIEVPGIAPTDIASALKSVGDARPANFMRTLFGRLRGIPSVRDVGGVSDLPLTGGESEGKFLILNHQPHVDLGSPKGFAAIEKLWMTAPGAEAGFRTASAGYFKALGIPLLDGRLFNEGDTASAAQVALVSESLARSVWPHEDPVGKTIEFGNMDGDFRLLTIVGVVGDVRAQALEQPPEPTVYVNYGQHLFPGGDFTVVMRSSVAPASVISAARKIVRDMDPNMAPDLRTFRAIFAASVESREFNVTLVGAFAGAAMLLAAVGIFGVMMYWVTARTREFGIRMALGARKRDVLKLVVTGAMTFTMIGVCIGIAASLALTRFLSALLYGVKPTDPMTFIVVSITLIAVALIACYTPARRATRVDPMVALRFE
jgi:putative ABC transport system permease protein